MGENGDLRPGTLGAEQKGVKREAPDDRSDPLWTPARAEDVARSLGVGPLLEKHWKVIALSREWHAQHGRAPRLRDVAAAVELTPRELTDLFRADPEMLIVRIAGLPDPEVPPARSVEQEVL